MIRMHVGESVMFLERPGLVDAEAAGDAFVLKLSKEAVFAKNERCARFKGTCVVPAACQRNIPPSSTRAVAPQM